MKIYHRKISLILRSELSQFFKLVILMFILLPLFRLIEAEPFTQYSGVIFILFLSLIFQCLVKSYLKEICVNKNEDYFELIFSSTLTGKRVRKVSVSKCKVEFISRKGLILIMLPKNSLKIISSKSEIYFIDERNGFDLTDLRSIEKDIKDH